MDRIIVRVKIIKHGSVMADKLVRSDIPLSECLIEIETLETGVKVFTYYSYD